MKNTHPILAIIITLLLLIAIAVSAMAAFDYARTLYASLNPQLAHALMAGLLAAATIAWFFMRVVRRIAAYRMRSRLSDEIAATYQYFVDYWSNVMSSADDNPEALQTLDRLMALYGGTEILKAHLSMREMQQDSDARSSEMRAQFGKALLAMRRELGAGTAGFSAAQLQQLVMQEPSAVAPAAELPQSEPALDN